MARQDSPVRIPDINNELVYALLDIISDGIWDWNANSGYVYRNPGWYRMLGYDPHSLQNNVFTWESVIHPDDFNRVMEHFDAYIKGKSDSYLVEYRCKHKQDNYIWIEDRGKIVAWNTDGSVARMIGAHKNIHESRVHLGQLKSKNKSLELLIEERTQELINLNAELQKKLAENKSLAETDTLTSVANRYLFEKVLKQECGRAHRFNHPISIIAMDLDDFKSINDSYGHSTGDLALIHVVNIIKENIRNFDLIARWGGDEFMLILPETSLDKAKTVADKIRTLVASSPVNKQIYITMSFGVASLYKDEDHKQLTIRADRALYKSKAAGKNIIRD